MNIGHWAKRGMACCLNGIILALALCWPCFGKAYTEPPIVAKVGLCPAILARRQKDHRICLQAEGLDEDTAVHVYMTLSDFELPLSFTLGWFVVVALRSDEVVLDEFGERIPLPGQKPQRKGFNRADLAEIRGFDYLGNGNLKAALKEFASAAKLAPNSAKAHNNYGACLAVLGKWGSAQAELDLALKFKKDYAIALSNRAWLALMYGQPELALRDSDNALTVQDGFRQALLAKGRAFLALQKVREAQGISEAICKQWSADPQASILAGDIALAQENVKEARGNYKKALVLCPGNATLLVKMAQAAGKIGNLDLAIKEARQATQAKPDDAQAHFLLGKLLEMNREEHSAQIQYERAIEVSLSPKESLSFYGPLIRVLLKTGQVSQAEKLSRQCLDKDEQCAECHYNRAWLLSRLPGNNKKIEAISAYRQAISINPNLSPAHYNLALLLLEQGKPEDAQRELRLFINQAPNDPDIVYAKELLAKLSH